MVKEIRYYNEAQRIKFEEEAIKELALEFYHEQKLAGNEEIAFKIITDYTKQNNNNSIFQYLHERIELIPIKIIKYTSVEEKPVKSKKNIFKNIFKDMFKMIQKVARKLLKKEGK